MMYAAARLASLSALAATLGAAPLAAAPGGLGLSVTPGKIELTIHPGSTANIPVLVRNDSPLPAHVVLSMADFTVDDAGTYHYEAPSPNGTSLATWLAVRPREFDIAAGSFQQIQVSVIVPDRELSGEYAGVLFIQTRPPREPGGMTFSARFADKVYATVGSAHRDGRVDRVDAERDGTGKEHYRVVFHNTGTMHVYLNGRIEIRRDGAVVQALALPKNVLVERGGERTIEVAGNRLTPAPYDIVAIVDYGGDTRTGGRVHFDAH